MNLHKFILHSGQLKQHIESKHSDISTFACQFCGKEYQNALVLHNHAIFHHYHGLFQCSHRARITKEDCQFVGKTRQQVCDHYESTHRKRRPSATKQNHLCPYGCGQSFKNERLFNKHRKTMHPMVKPYACKEKDCPFRSARFSDVANHARFAHLKDFYESSDLANHQDRPDPNDYVIVIKELL